MADIKTLGLALSGGGSRAAAFHCGTLRALSDLKLTSGATVADEVDVVSTVSGGSVFGGAWAAAKVDGRDNDEFLSRMRLELSRGFIRRSLRPSALRMLLPGHTRSDVIASTFNRAFFAGKALSSLPDRPALVLNVTVLNNGQVGKFSKDGFSVWGLRHPNRRPQHLEPIPAFPLALAVTASAAFPIGLPPVRILRKDFSRETTFERSDGGHYAGFSKGLSLTDGGVLENLGIQTLLRSRRYACRHLIISDAGTADDGWSRKWYNSAKSIGLGFLGGSVLDRIMLIMNFKQNRWARQQAIEEINTSWLVDAVQTGARETPVRALAESLSVGGRRATLFVRIDTNWRRFFAGIPRHILDSLGVKPRESSIAGPDLRKTRLSERGLDTERAARLLRLGVDLLDVDRFTRAGVNLEKALEYYERLGGDRGARVANSVATSFSALSSNELDKLQFHAAWQVHAADAIYGLTETLLQEKNQQG